MDLYSVKTYLKPSSLTEVTGWSADQRWLAGGTWLFNEVQPQVKSLVDMQQFDWTEIAVSAEGLSIGATCIQNELLAFSFPPEWTAAEALKDAVRELASFKLSHAATVGGNLCLALSASTFAPVMVALKAQYEIWRVEGEPYSVSAADFQTAPQKTVLQPGDVLRKIKIPRESLEQWQTRFKRMAVCTAGYAIAIVVTAYNPHSQQVRFGIGGSVLAPCLVEFDVLPTPEGIATALQEKTFLSDERGSAAYRQHITGVLMKRGIAALSADVQDERRY
ncbi:MAG: FAD binding domain-containing protein [Phormidesmis sp.]